MTENPLPGWCATFEAEATGLEIADLLRDYGTVSGTSIEDPIATLVDVIDSLGDPSALVKPFQGQVRRAGHDNAVRASTEWHTDAIFSIKSERYTGLASISATGESSTNFISAHELAQELVARLGAHVHDLLAHHTASNVRRLADANHGGAFRESDEDAVIPVIESSDVGTTVCRYSPLTVGESHCPEHGSECRLLIQLPGVWRESVNACEDFSHVWRPERSLVVWDNQRVLHRADLSKSGQRTLFRARFGGA